MKIILPFLAAAVAWSQATPTQTDWIYQVKNKPFVDVRQYNYPAQTPGGILTASSPATVTLHNCPQGVTGTDTRLRFYISGGTGTAESVASTGSGSCVPGSVGTVKFTPANSHSGAWTISDSSLGIYPAVAANPFNEVHIPAGEYDMRDCISLPNKSLILTGAGYDAAGTSGTKLAFAGIPATGCTGGLSSAILIDNTGGGSVIDPITLRGFLVVGNGATTPLINGIEINNMTRVLIQNMMVSGFAANCITSSNSFEIHISDRTQVQFCGNWGISINGTSNVSSISDTYVSFNSRSNGAGGVAVAGDGSSPSTVLLMRGVVVEATGKAPFTTVTVAFPILVSNTTSVTLINNWVEGNVGGSPSAQIIYAGGVASVVEIGNNIAGNASTAATGIDYGSDTTAVISYGNTFFASNSTRTFEGTNFSTYLIGPDTCTGGSTECTAHPQMAGVPQLAAYTFATLPTKPNGSQLYCSDCNSSCTGGGGSGRTCFRENSAWTH